MSETYYLVTGTDMKNVADTIRIKNGTSENLIWPTEWETAILNISSTKTQTGTFTGNGTRQVSISCNFQPDLVYWDTDPGSDAYTGTVSGLIARGLLAANQYRNNTTSNSNNIQRGITGMNTGGSSYNFKATYENNTVTLYCFSSGARSLFLVA